MVNPTRSDTVSDSRRWCLILFALLLFYAGALCFWWRDPAPMGERPQTQTESPKWATYVMAVRAVSDVVQRGFAGPLRILETVGQMATDLNR